MSGHGACLAPNDARKLAAVPVPHKIKSKPRSSAKCPRSQIRSAMGAGAQDKEGLSTGGLVFSRAHSSTGLPSLGASSIGLQFVIGVFPLDDGVCSDAKSHRD